MNTQETIQLISEALTPLATKIGEGGEYVFNLAVRQVYINAIEDTIWFTITSLACYGFYRFLRWGFKKEEESCKNNLNKNDLEIFTIIAGVILFIVSLLVLDCTIDSLLALFNPEYAAIENILKMIKANAG